jgi:hypothetical protein
MVLEIWGVDLSALDHIGSSPRHGVIVRLLSDVLEGAVLRFEMR